MKILKTTLLIFVFVSIALKGSAQKQLLKLEDIWSSRQFFAAGLPEIRSMNDGLHFTELINDEKGYYIVVNEFSTGKSVDTLLNSNNLNKDILKSDIHDYMLNADETKILLSSETEAIYRHSTKANNYVYDIKNKNLTAVSDKGKQQYATFSPDGKSLAFVRDNNLYLVDYNSNQEKMITRDGKKNEIINGATDWVYEEEFSFDQAYQWSPDGQHLAYYRFNETAVKEFNLTYYGSLYPREEKYKYPKAGEINSIVEIYIHDLSTGKTVKTDVNKEADQYIPRIKWMSAGKLCVMRMNRLQNKLELYACDSKTGKASLFFSEENKAYLEINDHLHFLSDNRHFVHTSTKDGYNHIYLYNIPGNESKQLTKGNWDVTDFYGYDEKNKLCYFQAAMKNPMERQVYAVNSSGKIINIAVEGGTNTATFSKNYNYYFISHSASGVPYDINLYDQAGNKIRTIEDNAKVKETLSKFTQSKTEFFNFKTREGIQLNGWMLKPPGFDPAKKYPVIQYMYGGPNSQTATDEWAGPNYLWFQLLAQKGYLIVTVDNRGTGARGEEFNKCIYKQLGKLETVDQIETAKWLGTLPYVDASRIGAWGWSYGGYLTSLLMTKGADFFKAAIAVAPVTNWRFYDTIYTERYLQTPQLNPAGYDDNSPINFVKQLKGKFLLVHGTADDNVHFQNSMEFVTALVKEKKQFNNFFYPDKAHGISGVRLHLYEMMTNFFVENL